jgi:hypothetical protein
MNKRALAYRTPQHDVVAPQTLAPAAPQSGVGEMDAAVCLDMLIQAYEAPARRAVAPRPSRAQWASRARLALGCAVAAVLIGGAAGTLSSLSTF